MNSKQQKTLKSIFAEPVKSDIDWKDIESLVIAFGGVVKEGSGSRVKFYLNTRIGLFHRPHPSRFAVKGAVRSVRKFLENAGVTKNGI